MIIEIPGKGSVEFPDTMSEDAVSSAIRQIVAPPPPPTPERKPLIPQPADTGFNLMGILGKAQEKLAEGPKALFNLAGKADVAAGIKTPEEAASRAQTYGNITRDVAEGAAMPWAKAPGLAGFLTRAGQSGLLSAAQNPQAPATAGAAGAAMGGATELGSKGLRYLFSAIPERLFASQTGRDIASWLKANVPAWSGMRGNAKGLYEMAHGEGQRHLSDEFAKAITEASDAIPPGTQVEIMADMATKAGIKEMRDVANARDLPIVSVDARELLDKLPSLGRKSDPNVRRSALTALEQALPDGVIPEARRAYQIGQGWINFAEKGKFLAGEKYDPVKAMEALTSVGKKSLLARNLDPIRDIVRGPMPNPMTKYTPSGLGFLLGKEALGAGVGHLAGGPVGAGVGAIGAALVPKPTLYGNVPVMMPAVQQARRALTQGGISEVIRDMMLSGD